jgi:hypothetical protein
MAKRTTQTITTFTVSWFGIGADEVQTIRCLSRASAHGIVETLKRDFAKYPDHKPLIHVDRGEAQVDR